MPTVDVIVAVVWLSAATFVTRAGFLLVGRRVQFPPAVEAALRYAPACALSALVVPEILGPTGAIDVSWANARWPAALVASAYLLWRPSIVGCIVSGMFTYAAIRLWTV
jgi:branched-subunit amino acid transport protein